MLDLEGLKKLLGIHPRRYSDLNIEQTLARIDALPDSTRIQVKAEFVPGHNYTRLEGDKQGVINVIWGRLFISGWHFVGGKLEQKEYGTGRSKNNIHLRWDKPDHSESFTLSLDYRTG